MNDVERFLDRACCGVGGSPELRRHLRKELQEHLTAEIDGNIAAGMAREEAAQKAMEEFGDPVMIRDGLQAVHGRRLTTLLIEKSMAWKERTMKTGWKWSFVAHVALILTIAAEVFLVVAPPLYILPQIFALHEHLGTPTFAYLGTIRGFLGLLLFDLFWIPWLCMLLVLAGWGVFEWKYRSENKSTVRLAGLSLVSFVMFLLLAMICVPMTIDLAILPGQIYELQVNLTPQQAQSIVFPRIAEGDAAFEELSAAIDREDWQAMDLSAKQLSDTYQSLRDISGGTMVLAGENQRNNLEEIRYLIREIEEFSDKIHHRFVTYEYSKSQDKDNNLKLRTLTYFKRLQEYYSQLRTKSDLFRN
ncbi:MAG: hypothetical protein JSU70_20275 [Phycisphaerales bacterium]|nr:MAG: hypothetical protein JSU70_20275 [Phycisphaerales bacterium]